MDKRKSLLVALALALCCNVDRVTAADSWTCTQGSLTRNVDVFYADNASRLPCRVYYSKPGESVMPRLLWNASSQLDYCRSKADAFVTRLESWGWRCRISPEPPAQAR
ncbi:MAG: hypothetical protein KDI82_05240 [Gammaproteobacteria bacterium]|nr:hypothetical protein [Gammaproteobacteria bacterium]